MCIGQFVTLPQSLIVIVVVGALAVVAAWGILESVLLASLFTLIEAGGLIVIIVAALYIDLPFAGVLLSPPPFDAQVLSGIAFASLLAFFAFIGFEDLANVVEEAKEPHRDIPRDGLHADYLDRALCLGRRRRRHRGAGRGACHLAGAVEPGVYRHWPTSAPPPSASSPSSPRSIPFSRR